jgi:hypothetical protein
MVGINDDGIFIFANKIEFATNPGRSFRSSETAAYTAGNDHRFSQFSTGLKPFTVHQIITFK